MRKTINVDGKDIPLRASGATPEKYKAYFGQELLDDFFKVTDSFNKSETISSDTLGIVKRIMYIMAKQADKEIPDDYIDWLDQFDNFPVEAIAVDVITLFANSLKTSVEPKNV